MVVNFSRTRDETLACMDSCVPSALASYKGWVAVNSKKAGTGLPDTWITTSTFRPRGGVRLFCARACSVASPVCWLPYSVSSSSAFWSVRSILILSVLALKRLWFYCKFRIQKQMWFEKCLWRCYILFFLGKTYKLSKETYKLQHSWKIHCYF